jgi:hypothetical protein
VSRQSSSLVLPFGGELAGLDPDLPSSRGFIALLEAFRGTGGTAPGEIVGRLLEEHLVGQPTSLATLVHSGQAFGFAWRANLWLPMFQFDGDHLGLKVGVQRVRAHFPSLWSGWTVASWFAAPNVCLAGRCPADVFDADAEAVLRAALALHSPATPAARLRAAPRRAGSVRKRTESRQAGCQTAP